MKTALLVLLLASTCAAQTAVAGLPDNPEPIARRSPADRPFLDRTARFALGTSAAIFTADAVTSCRHHGREDWLPVQSCQAISLWMAGNFAEQVSVSYLLHRTHHYRLERIAEFVGPLGSAIGIVYTLSHHGRLQSVPIPGGHVVSVCIVGQTC